MADISGPGGNFTSITGFTAHFSGWSATLNVTLGENTGFAENGNRTSLPTAQIITGSAVGTGVAGSSFFASTVTGATPTMSSYTGTITRTAASGSTCSFNANVSAVALNRQFDGKMDYGISFQSSGPLTGQFGT